MTPEKKLENLRNGIGVIAELSFLFFNDFIKAGFTEAQALMLTNTFMTNFITTLEKK